MQVITSFITSNDIEKYKNHIENNGVNGAVDVYKTLYQKGYTYAGWAGGVATGDALTGQAAIGYMQSSHSGNQPINVDNIRVGMALHYLNALSSMADSNGQIRKDVDYKQVHDFHKTVFDENGLDIENWTLKVPMDIIGKYGGGADVQEAMWQVISRTGGDGLDAWHMSTALTNAVVQAASGSVYVDKNGVYKPGINPRSVLEKPETQEISPEDVQRANEWLKNVASSRFGFPGLFNHYYNKLYDWIFPNVEQDYECVDNWCKLNRSGQSHTVDPLALDLDGDGLETVSHNRFSGSLFDHSGEGIRTATGWLKGDDGFLVYDRNGNGVIDDGTELFGDSTILADGSRAAHGYAALAEWDSNGDGKVDAEDAGFASLRVWRDINQDGISQSDELFTLADVGVLSLSLQYTTPNQNLGNGNFLAQSGSYTRTDGSTALMGDLDLGVDRLFARHSQAVELTEEQMQAANLQGMGRVRDLRQAAALSGSLADVLAAYSGAVNDSVWEWGFQAA